MSEFGVGVVGFGWMGQVHARAYERVRQHYPQLPLRPRLVTVAEPDDAHRADAEDRFAAETVTDWRDVVADERITAVSVTAPNFLHREIGSAIAAAGKHLWIEKPVGVGAADARAVADAVAAAGLRSAVGFNYRNAPAVEHARALIDSGAIGRVTNARFRLLADYAAHPDGALSWRFERAAGGAGVLGDLGSHGIDLVRFLLGEIAEVVADSDTFIAQRPRPTGSGSHFDLAAGGEPGPVENEDWMSALLRLHGGTHVALEASRVSVGDQCTYGFEIHGTRGALAWDFRRMGELTISSGADYLDQPSSTKYVTPRDGELGAFQPGSGITLGYDDLKVIEAARFVRSIAESTSLGATIADAVAAAETLDAIAESARDRRWVTVGTTRTENQ